MKGLIAPELWWLLSVRGLPPLRESHLPSHPALGRRSHREVGIWRAFCSQKQLIPTGMLHPCPAAAPFTRHPRAVAAGAAFPCREAVLGLTESWPCCVLDLIVLFSLPQGGSKWLQVGFPRFPRAGSPHGKIPPEQGENNGQETPWLQLGSQRAQGCGLFGKITLLGSASDPCPRPHQGGPPRVPPGGSPGQPSCGYWENQTSISLLGPACQIFSSAALGALGFLPLPRFATQHCRCTGWGES